MSQFADALNSLFLDYAKTLRNPARPLLINHTLSTKQAFALPTGTLVSWTPPASTGRSPKDTYIVKNEETEKTVDWSSPNCIPMEPNTFSKILEDVLTVLRGKERLYVLDRAVGADPAYSLPILTVTDNPLSALFLDNMFRPVPNEIGQSCFKDKPFILIGLPKDFLVKERYRDKLRTLPDGSPSDIAVVMDFKQRIGVVYGSSYMGSLKKLIFTVMNYYLPQEGILSLHCSANESFDGKSALFLGLSGTGKTTLSADSSRMLVGDDEHGWNENGIANFENGCYAKLINLNPLKEPEIYNATFHPDIPENHGAVVENMMVYPDGTFDLADGRFTENSRGSFPLCFLKNIKPSAVTVHPSTILFLTADAYGVLPPISKLNPDQAMFWFLMGYTSKLAGTETGITEPQATFSRFFGEPFMPLLPKAYTSLLGEKLAKHKVDVYLVNTGWSGGSYGIGKRMDILLTRKMVNAALSGTLAKAECKQDPIFKLFVPQSCPGVPAEILNPEATWKDKAAYKVTAEKLAGIFKAHFLKVFAGKVDQSIADQCPGC